MNEIGKSKVSSSDGSKKGAVTPLSAKPSCLIVIPVYNEASSVRATVERIQKVVARILSWSFEIVLVNDGSTDGTAEILESFKGVTVITHHVNRGYGAALRTGLDSCRHEWVFITDADSTYPIEDLPKLLSRAELGADMVVGARHGTGINTKPFHRVARWVLRKMAHTLSGVMVPDLNSGMRVFRYQLYRDFRNLLPMGFSFTTTITLAALYNNYRTEYVSIPYFKRSGTSNIKPVSDFFAFSLLIIRIASYFEPLRFFLPVAMVICGLGFVKGSIDFINLGYIGSFAVLMFLMGVQVFVSGILAEVIVKRSSSTWRATTSDQRTSVVPNDQVSSVMLGEVPLEDNERKVAN